MQHARPPRTYAIDLERTRPAPNPAPGAGSEEAFFVDPQRAVLVPRGHTPSALGQRLLGALCWFGWVRRLAEDQGLVPITDPVRILAGLRRSLGSESESPSFETCLASAVQPQGPGAQGSLVHRTRIGLAAFQEALTEGRDRDELHDRLAQGSPVRNAQEGDRQAIRTAVMDGFGTRSAHAIPRDEAERIYQAARGTHCRERNEILLGSDDVRLAHFPATMPAALVDRLKAFVRRQPTFQVAILDAPEMATCVKLALMDYRRSVIQESLATDSDTAHQIAMGAWVTGTVPDHYLDDLSDREVRAWNDFVSHPASARVFHSSVADRAKAQLQEPQARRVEPEELDVVVGILANTFEAREAALLAELLSDEAPLSVRIAALRGFRTVTVRTLVETYLDVRPAITGWPNLTDLQRTEILALNAGHLMDSSQARAYCQAVVSLTTLCRSLSSTNGATAPTLFNGITPAANSLHAAVEAVKPRDDGARDALIYEMARVAMMGLGTEIAAARALRADMIIAAIKGPQAGVLWSILNSPKVMRDRRRPVLGKLPGALYQAALVFKGARASSRPLTAPEERALWGDIPGVEISDLPSTALQDAVRNWLGIEQSRTSKAKQAVNGATGKVSRMFSREPVALPRPAFDRK